ncbi:hypothetical protein [Paenibacillus sp. KS-LC4]|uniref:hypothetical protein n=1 Tax=Paenibacillus sp. KS-LC4 TaxID=2979727 RepID=UPI0030CED38B
MGLLWRRWVAIRTESGSRADIIDRLEAHLKASGIKAKVTLEGNLKRLHVLKKNVEAAQQQLDAFDSEP